MMHWNYGLWPDYDKSVVCIFKTFSENISVPSAGLSILRPFKQVGEKQDEKTHGFVYLKITHCVPLYLE